MTVIQKKNCFLKSLKPKQWESLFTGQYKVDKDAEGYIVKPCQ